MTRRIRRLLAEQLGVAALEFGLVGPTLVLLILFITVSGLLLWGKGVMQMAASQTARCAAVSSSDCTNRQTYAEAVINAWGAGGLLLPISVAVQSNAACNGTTGQFSVVTISSTQVGIAQYVPALSSTMLSASACYPSGT